MFLLPSFLFFIVFVPAVKMQESPCSLCSDGSTLYADTDIVRLPGLNITCDEAAQAASVERAGSAACSLQQGFGYGYCRCPSPSPRVYNCQLCSLADEGPINPNAVVPLPDSTTATCRNLDFTAQVGVLDENSCVFLQNIAPSVCCGTAGKENVPVGQEGRKPRGSSATTCWPPYLIMLGTILSGYCMI